MGRRNSNNTNFRNSFVNNDDSGYEDNYIATRDILGYYPPDCPSCGTAMKFNFGTNTFKCFHCGYTIEEDIVDSVLDQDSEYDDIYDDPDESEIPECCKACGGPWPKCQTSCKIFDDD